MKILLFGATGMIGQGVLRESLLDPEVESVLCVGRAATGQTHDKLREIVHADLFDLGPIAAELEGRDACLFCLGVSSAGMREADYRRVTYDLTLSVARTLAERSPGMTFLYISGAGTDSSEKGGSMWARVKGETENALLKLPFRAAYMLRPGYIQPLHGITSKTTLYRVLYAGIGPLYPVLKALAPNLVTTTEGLGRAMLLVARKGAPKKVLEVRDLNEVLERG
jgi:uncharacterized protein YbjT (DUF2867 family)